MSARAVAWILALAVTLSAGCRGGPRDTSHPSILLAVVGACGAAGAPLEADPGWNALRADPDAVAFGEHLVQSPRSAPSVDALLTGRFVFEQRGRAADTPPRSLLDAWSEARWPSFAVVRKPPAGPLEAWAGRVDQVERPAPGVRREALVALLRESAAPFLGLIDAGDCATDDARGAVAPPVALDWIVEALEASGRYDDTVLVVTGDHAGLDPPGPAGLLHRERLHVPLLVKLRRGTRPPGLAEVRTVTRAIDLLPSLLDLAGLPIEEGLSGERILRGAVPTFSLAESERGWALVQDDLELVATRDGQRLYDFRADPGRTRDLSAELPERAAAMRRIVAFLRGAADDDPERGLDPEALEELESLGYIR